MHTRIVFCALLMLLALSLAIGQTPGGFDLTLFDLDGTAKVIGRLPQTVYAPRVSPDGKRIAFETRDNTGPDGPRLWIADLADLAGRRSLANTPGPLNWAPMWTPDGERLVYLVSGEKPDAVYTRRADGTGTPEHLLDTRSAEGWMDRGTQMRFLTLKANNDYGISSLDMVTRKVTPLVDLPGSAQHSSAVSPVGPWLAYASNETGRYEVWLEPLPPNGMRYQLTKSGGSHPLWAPDGRSLYFDRDRQLFLLAVNTSDPSSSLDPVALPIKGFVQAEYRRQFDLMPNGRQFLALIPVPAR
jgi:Tol biopolymer transport system component